jgi:hypothetical protein
MEVRRITRLEINGVFTREMTERLVDSIKRIDDISFDVKTIETQDHFRDIKREVVYDKIMGVFEVQEYSTGIFYKSKKWREQV